MLPLAETFTDALYQARITEEQERQLAELHKEANPVKPQVVWQSEWPHSAKTAPSSPSQQEGVSRKEAAPARSNGEERPDAPGSSPVFVAVALITESRIAHRKIHPLKPRGGHVRTGTSSV